MFGSTDTTKSVPITPITKPNSLGLIEIKSQLIEIKRQCDNSHKHCIEIVQRCDKFPDNIDETYFNEFIRLTSSFHYSSCLSQHYNTRHLDIKRFILSNSKKFKINKFDSMFTFMSDTELYQLITNQQVLDPELITKLINLEIIQNYGQRIFLFNLLITNQPKLKTFEHILMLMTLGEFSKYLDKMVKSFISSVDEIIIRFIVKNKTNLMLKENYQIGLKILNTFISKPKIVFAIYPLISEHICSKQKKEIFNKSVSSYDKNLMLLMLEKKDIQPDIVTITKLIERTYVRPEGASNSKQIAEIIDMMCDYGLVINRHIIMKLLEHGCYVNNLEKHDIVVDNEILAKCANLSYYPYKFDIIPTTDILIKECSKHDNLTTIKKLKEFGGKYTTECLEEACKIAKNGRAIKYLITECGIKVSDKCLEYFQEAYKIDALDSILKKYKSQNPIKDTDTIVDNKKNIELNNKSIMTVTPRNIKIDIKNDTIEYNLKNKVRKFFELKKKTIKYSELYEIVLKYLVTNKLVISKYFVINIELSNLLKINHCVILDISELHNILTYFIDLTETNQIQSQNI